MPCISRPSSVAVKPARELKAGDTVQLRSGATLRTVLVRAISDRRGGAPEAAKTAGAAVLPTREQHTRNFEVDHVSEKRVVQGGVLRRMTVAVVIDGNRTKDEVDKIAGLVRSAVGFDERRGDALREAARFLPLDRVMIETDAPYLLPRDLEPRPRTRRNEPMHLPHVLRTLARLMDVTPERLAEASTRNAEALFGL